MFVDFNLSPLYKVISRNVSSCSVADFVSDSFDCGMNLVDV